MTDVTSLVTDNLSVWTSAIKRKSAAGRGGSKKFSLYGIEKLRALILDLAVRGKLVPQDSTDQPVSELLKLMEAEGEKLYAEGKIRKPKKLPPTKGADVLFDLPEGWECIRLGQIGDWGAGATPSRGNPSYYGGQIPWFKSGELAKDDISESKEFVTEQALKECSLRYNVVGDVLIAMYGATIGKVSILSVDATTNQAVCACSPFLGVYNRFLLVLLKAMRRNFVGQGTGGAQPNISREKIVATLAAIPPAEEQHRIVAKVDELMTLCDVLEAGAYEAIKAHEVLVKTLLATLTNSKDAQDLATNWTRLETHFDTLFTTEASVDQLKQTILQLAVMGCLTKRRKCDAQIDQTGLRPDKQAEKFDLKSFIARASKFHLPEGWLMHPLSRVTTNIVDCPHTTPKWTEEGFFCIRSSQVKVGLLELGKPNFVSEATYYERIERLEPTEGDILYIREGGILGVACRVPADTPLCLGQRLMLLRSGKSMVPEFLELVLNSPWIAKYAEEKTTGGAAPRVNMTLVRAYPIPIPPVQEQRRIVAKVEELLALCESLKSRISNVAIVQKHLADTIVAKAVA